MDEITSSGGARQAQSRGLSLPTTSEEAFPGHSGNDIQAHSEDSSCSLLGTGKAGKASECHMGHGTQAGRSIGSRQGAGPSLPHWGAEPSRGAFPKLPSQLGPREALQ